MLHHHPNGGGVGDVADQQILRAARFELKGSQGAACVKSSSMSLVGDEPRLRHVEGTFEVVSDEQRVVFCGFFQHAVASVGAGEFQATRRLTLKAVQRGGRFRERDDVKVPVVVVVDDGRQIHADANDREFACPAAKVEACSQVRGRCAERGRISWRRGVFKHPNPIHVAGENVRLSVAVVIAKKAPIHHLGKSQGPLPVDRQVSVGQTLKDENPTSVAVERHQVVVSIEVGVEGGPLGGGQSPGPCMIQ